MVAPPLPPLVFWSTLGVCGLADLTGRSPRRCGIDRETRRQWTRHWLLWSVWNSAELATGVLTRPGCFLFLAYLVSIACAPTLTITAGLGVLYGTLRCSGHLLLRPAVRAGRSGQVLAQRPRRRRLTGAAASLAAVVALVVVTTA
ncbi:MAG: hypothetical protein AAB131_03910 [Actinomycetota bacterium]